MMQSLEQLARFLIVALGVDMTAFGLGALILAGAVGLAAVAVLVTLSCVVVAANPGTQSGRPRCAPHDRAPVACVQSAPDTPGKPRPRAPGRVLAVATH